MTRRIFVDVTRDYVCPSCGPSAEFIIDPERGDVICKSCGTVIGECIVDLGPEWRKPEAARASSGPVGTIVGDIEYGNIKIPDKIRAIRLKKLSKPISTSIERVQLDAKEFMESARELLGIPKVVAEDAAMLYKRAYVEGFRAPRREGFASALYYAMKKHGIAPVTHKTFVEKLGLDRGAFISAYMEFLKIMSKLGERVPRTDPKIYIPKIVSGLKLDGEISADIQRVAVDLLKYLLSSPTLRNGRKPQVLAAVAVYYACYIVGIEVTQKDIARAADSTETPIRDVINELSKRLYVELQI